ncbi:two component, sigma54 specific, transcriptional regulator, Fis family [Solidesulfovibrio carbinoliphilus subsp. oakridgensis]|uniref:Two component, sigma54 specific, transcriptional regulator, Fis family n=1 Tax=Solidesulfovibrio carbinoliphilus subsp. oakridgensis TaxID=694327 RepID=G7QB30_9BACT|nr:sigma-54 dependent transcriptional regulator [Solidesulfovibrio carbinoliphilus]EHJ48772.1 two component, sigma54 specific, transcriptional regulator, Fis family [Solidesulfovibrio carbinoliphilus subsp. oakridgensis]
MKPRIAVVDDETIVCNRLSRALAKDGAEVEAFTEGQAFLARHGEAPFDLVFLDLMLPDGDGISHIPAIKAVSPGTEIIVITGYGSIETAIAAVKEGAFHYVQKPVKLAEVRQLAQTALERAALRQENLRLRQVLKGAQGEKPLIGLSPALRKVFAMIDKVAPVDCNVLLTGASGTGKELVARAVHRQSARRDRPFVPFNCGAFTEDLGSSELFGYEKGAFTGATATKIGLLESATGGTVFLDEIGEMPLSMQVKLLRAIQERRILRVGGIRPIDLDIRIVAATNKDLKHEAATGAFREDLFFRLNVVTIHLPRLSERREDVAPLAEHFLEKYNRAFRKVVRAIDPEALAILTAYSYPGNVRELENIIERGVALTEGDTLLVKDLPSDLRQLSFDSVEGEGLVSLEEMERRYIARVLERTGYNKGLAAQVLGLPRTTLWRKLKQYGLE